MPLSVGHTGLEPAVGTPLQCVTSSASAHVWGLGPHLSLGALTSFRRIALLFNKRVCKKLRS